ncbi:MAG: SLC13 family permease [Spirochaetota bacterium]|nr:SLC13 family permease [Spirochaetota bacterium]
MKLSHKKALYLFLAIGIALAIGLLPIEYWQNTGDTSIQLTTQGKYSLAVLAFAVIGWVTEIMPFAITGLFSLSLLVITGCAHLPDLVKDGFGNQVIVFFIGVMIIGAIVNETSFVSIITQKLYKRYCSQPKTLIFIILAIGMILAGFVTEMAAAAMVLPFAVSILKRAHIEPLKDNYGKAMMIACGWGPVIGGISTPAGSGANPLTVGFLKDLAHIDLSFAQWMGIGFPAALLMLPFAWYILVKTFNIESVSLHVDTEHNEKIQIPLHDIIIGILFMVTILLWIFEPVLHSLFPSLQYITMSFVAITIACCMFLPPFAQLSWHKVEHAINWGAIILIVSGLALGTTIYKTGAAKWLAWVLFKNLNLLHPVVMVFAVVIGVSIVKVMFSSNTVTGIIMVPLLIALSGTTGIDPALVAIPAGLTSSLSFILVTSTPTIVIPYTAGYFTIADMVKPGIYMTIVSSICVTISFLIFGSLFNIITW